MSEIEKTTLLSMAMAQLDFAIERVEAGDVAQTKAAVGDAKKMVEEVYDRQMAEDDK